MSEISPCQRSLHLGEDADKTLTWRVARSQNAPDTPLSDCKVLLKVGANELVFAAKDAVKRGLCDAGPFNDAVNTDDVHAFRIEELVGGGQQAVSRGSATGSLRLDGGLNFRCLGSHASVLTVLFLA